MYIMPCEDCHHKKKFKKCKYFCDCNEAIILGEGMPDWFIQKKNGKLPL